MIQNRTIYALSSARGKAGVAVIRISGHMAKNAAEKLCGEVHDSDARKALLRDLVGPCNSLIDKAIIVYFKAPHSFTGEDVVEIFCHGSNAVVAKILDLLSQTDGLHPAEHGEFSRQAFMNEKMDLTAVEGLYDLINSDTEKQRQLAVAQLSGHLKNLYDLWRTRIIEIYAITSAYIDFPDEDIDIDIARDISNKVNDLISAITTHLQSANKGELITSGIKCAIIGRPNVGKSSLLNYIAGRDAAIVSSIAGTTRDVIEVSVDIAGYKFIIYDTAGIRETEDVIESIGVDLAIKKAENSQIILFMYEVGDDVDAVLHDKIEHLEQKKSIIIFNKCDGHDEHAAHDQKMGQHDEVNDDATFYISAKTGLGVDKLELYLGQYADHVCKHNDDSGGIATRARYRTHLLKCIEYLGKFQDAIDGGEECCAAPIEIMAEYIKLSADEIAAITGVVDIENVLGEVFSKFCIGK